MVGYLRGRRTGAAIYNVVHWYVTPALLAGLMAIGLITPHWWICLIWVSHIAFDRAVGYGLKFTSAFRDTHLSVSTVSGEYRTSASSWSCSCDGRDQSPMSRFELQGEKSAVE
jgi:hypothetical protein